MNTVIHKNNTYNVVRVKGLEPAAWTIRNANHNTFYGEIEITSRGTIYRATSALDQTKATINVALIQSAQELAEWAVKALHPDNIKPMR